MLGQLSWQKGGGPKKRFQYCLNRNSSKHFLSCISEQFRDIQEVISLILHCKTMYCCLMTLPSTSTTSGTIKSELIPRGRSLRKDDRQSMFFTDVYPMYAREDLEEAQHDLEKPRIAVYTNTWKSHQNTVYWCNLKLAQRKGLQFYQTRSHAITLFQHTTCDLYWESGFHEDWRRIILEGISITKVTACCTCAYFAIWTSGSA